MIDKKISAFKMAEDFYDLFFISDKKVSIIDYLDNSFCDEIGEIDLINDRFSVFYHVDGKYVSPPFDGSYSTLYPFLVDSIIHPDDREICVDLLNPDTMLDNLKKSKYKNFRFAHLRYQLQDGSWRWIEEAIITGEEYGIPQGVVRFYMFDIHNVKVRELGHTANDESGLMGKSRDDLTGLYNEKTFFAKCVSLAEMKKRVNWAALTLDIEHFKLFDEWYGRETGDLFLAKVGSCFRKIAEEFEGIAGYFGQDDFALFIPFNEKSFKLVFDEVRNILMSFGLSVGFMPTIGVAKLKDFNDIHVAFDRASVAGFRAKEDIKNRIQIYDPTMQLQSEKEYHAMLDFLDALKNNEITFYLQPQVRMSTKHIVGAEALARWIKSDGTIVPPYEFIPALEKYGFIADLDKYMWEKVCLWLRERLDQGQHVVPISINVSQVDIFTIDIPKFLSGLIKKYKLSPKLIKVEITESAYAETTSSVDALVKRLRELGFLILMDDFGSGYSSLNMLSNIKVDAIKLDAQFLNMDKEHIQNGIHILESIINMGKSINIPMIVEGIETLEQVNFLTELGCRYAQGFYYYRALPVKEFEALIEDENMIDDRGFVVKLNEQIQIREFLDQNIYSDAMLNNVLGAVAFYLYDGKESIDIIRFNQQFYESVNVPDFHDRLKDIQNYMPEEDKPKIYQLLNEAMEKRLTGSEGVLRFYKTDGSLAYYVMRFYYLDEKEGGHHFYGAANNITALSNLQSQLRLITKYTSDSIVLLVNKKGTWSFSVACHGLRDVIELDDEHLQKELDDGTFFNIHLADRTAKNIIDLALNNVKNNESFSTEFDYRIHEGKMVRLHMRADIVDDENSNVKYIFTVRPVNE